MFEKPTTERQEAPDPYDAVDFFEQHKFDKDLDAQFSEMTGGDPRNFFSEEVLATLAQMDPGTRTVLLARASMHVTTRPSDIGKYLETV